METNQSVPGNPGAGQVSERVFWLVAAAIVGFAAWLRFWGLDFGLPHPITRPDELPLLQQTALPAMGEFDLNWAVYPPAYVYLCWIWGEVGLMLAQLLGVGPIGDYRTLLAQNPVSLYPIVRSLSAVAGIAAVLVLMIIARRSFGNVAALVAGLLLATSFLHVRDSHTFKPDAVLSLAVLIALGTLVPLAARASIRNAVVAGLASGIAIAVKYPGVLLLAPLYVAAWMGSEKRGWRRFFSNPAIAAGAVAVAVFLLTSPFLFFSEGVIEFGKMMLAAYPQLSGVEPAAVLDPGLQLEGPELPLWARSGWWGGLLYHARFSLWNGIGWGPTLLAPFAVAWGIASREPLARLAAVFALLYFVTFSATSSLLSRYMTPLVPVIALLEAGLLVALAQKLRPRAGLLLVSLAALALAAQPLANAIAHNRIIAETDTRVLSTEWMQASMPPGSRVAIVGTRFWNWGAPQVPSSLRVIPLGPVPGTRIDYVVTHHHPLYWSEVDPKLLQRARGRLRLVADFDPFTAEREVAVFESTDAYYVPFQGFSGVSRPGPQIRIYAVD